MASRFIIYLAMVMLTIVSMWTTYISLRDSILPEPVIPIALPGAGVVWQCSVFALLLSVSIGLMLFGLKTSIINEQKRLNLLGVMGLTVVGFISIVFNMDVLYRTADKDFFIRHSAHEMSKTYEEYAAKAQGILAERRDTLRKEVAKQEAELSAEIEGIRQAPEGYGVRAKEEEYKLRLLESENSVELETVEAALEQKAQIDPLLAQTYPQNIEEVEKFQNDLRVAVRDLGAAAGLPMPQPVKLDSPIFAVFAKLFDFETIGMKEIFVLVIALFLDLGDIIGYSLIPSGKKRPKAAASMVLDVESFPPRSPRAEYVPEYDALERNPEPRERPGGEDEPDFFGESRLEELPGRRALGGG